jgi:hypothetical protein
VVYLLWYWMRGLRRAWAERRALGWRMALILLNVGLLVAALCLFLLTQIWHNPGLEPAYLVVLGLWVVLQWTEMVPRVPARR